MITEMICRNGVCLCYSSKENVKLSYERKVYTAIYSSADKRMYDVLAMTILQDSVYMDTFSWSWYTNKTVYTARASREYTYHPSYIGSNIISIYVRKTHATIISFIIRANNDIVKTPVLLRFFIWLIACTCCL